VIRAIPEGGCEKTECHNPHEKARNVGLRLKTLYETKVDRMMVQPVNRYSG